MRLSDFSAAKQCAFRMSLSQEFFGMNANRKYATAVQLMRDGSYTDAERLIFDAVANDHKFLKINRSESTDEGFALAFPSANTAPTAWIAYRIGHYLFHARKPGLAAEWFRQALDMSATGSVVTSFREACANFLLLSNFESSDEISISENLHLIEDWSVTGNNKCWLDLARGAASFLEGKHSDATDFIVRAQGKAAENGFLLPKVQQPMHTVLPWNDTSYDNLTNKPPPAQHISGWKLGPLTKPQIGTPVHFCAADVNYFTKFAEALAASASRAEFSGILHFHIVNHDDKSALISKRIDERFPELKINYSYSQYADDIHSKAYFATVRFLAANRIMDAYESDIFISDIDVGLSGNPEEYSALLKGKDLGVRIRPMRNYFPWKRVIVNLLYLRRSPGTYRILDYVSSYYRAVTQSRSGEAIWGVDQSAFFFALERGKHLGIEVQDLNAIDYRYVGFAGNNKMAWAAKTINRGQSIF